jgi:hypothetical protein
VSIVSIGTIYANPSEETMTDLDSHADVCVVGDNALIIQDFERPVDVSSYDPKAPIRKSVQTVSAALAYIKPEDGNTIILIVHQAL